MRKMEWLQDGSGLLTSARDDAPGGYQIWYISYPGGQVRRVTTELDNYLDVSVSRMARMAVVQQAKLLSSVWLVPLDSAGAARQIDVDHFVLRAMDHEHRQALLEIWRIVLV